MYKCRLTQAKLNIWFFTLGHHLIKDPSNPALSLGFPTKIAKLDFRENFAKNFAHFRKIVSRFSNNFRENFRLYFRENFRENGVNIFAKIAWHLNPLTSSYQQSTNLVEVIYLIKCKKRFYWSLLWKVIMLTNRKYRRYRRRVDTEEGATHPPEQKIS